MFTKKLAICLWSVLLMLVLGLGMAGPAQATCGDAIGCVNLAAGDSIHIAYLLAVTGGAASLGMDEKRGVEIAMDDAGGKILGHTILFDGQDGKCTSPDGATAGAALAGDSTIVAVIGTTCSGEAISAMSALSTAGFSVVSPSNTNHTLTKSGDPNHYAGYLRTSWNDDIQGETAAEYVKNKLGLTTASIIDNGGPYSTGIADTFAVEFAALGGTVKAHVTIDAGNTADMDAKLATIAADPPALLYIPVFSSPEGAYIVDHLPAGLSSVYLMGADGLGDLNVGAVSHENGVMYTSRDFTATHNSDYVSHFLPAYQTKYSEAPISQFHAHAYDAFMLIKAAIESVAVETAPGAHQIGRQALRDALYATTNHAGLTGNLTCSATGDCADPSMAVYTYQTDVSAGKYTWPSKIGLVMDAGGIGDKGFNDDAYQGLLQAESTLHVAKSLYLPDSSSYEAKLNQCADEGSGLCFGVGFSMGDAIINAANTKPNTSFAILDLDPASPPNNLRGIIFDEKQPGYLAGALAGKMTVTNIVGVVGGMEVVPAVVKFAEGYRNGAQCANPLASGLITYTNTFTDPDVGAAAAAEMINTYNADVIFGAAGMTGNGAILYSAQHGKWSIGVDTDQYLSVFGNGTISGHEKLLTSAMKGLDQAVLATTQDFLDGGFTSPPGTVTYNLNNNGVGLAPYHDADASITTSTKTYIADVKQKIIDGNIDINETCRRTISGDVEAPSATIKYTVNSIAKTTTSDSKGQYSITVPLGWSGTVKPTKTGHTFKPVSRTYTDVTTDQAAQNYATTMIVASTATQDGWILESSESSNTGGTMNATVSTFNLGDDAAKKQYRSILSFSTVGLPDTAKISKATLKVKSGGVTGGGNPVSAFQGFMVEVKKGTFGAAALALNDFNAVASKTYGPFLTPLSGGWYTISLASPNNYINKLPTNSGLTQIRLRFKLDDNNNAIANFLKIYSGNASAANRPQLLIGYTTP